MLALGGLAPSLPAIAHDDDTGAESREDRGDREDRESREDRDDDRSGSSDKDRDGERRGSSSGSSGKSGDDGKRDQTRREDSRRGRGRDTRFDVERDVNGADRERNEVLLIGPSAASDAVRNAGFSVISENRLETLRQTLIRVRVRDGETIERTIETLRDVAPGIRVAPNHIFHASQATPVSSLAGKIEPLRAPRRGEAAQIGVIDTGADITLPRLDSRVRTFRGFAPGGYLPRPHGTAVAQLASSLGASIAVADVFGLDKQKQLVAPAELIAMAIDWMLSEDVRILNISIEGPRNDVLEFVVDAAVSQGALIIAAAGNGGPAAAPGYPGAYPGVVPVTALDEHGIIYRRAARGDHIQFAARGSYGPGQSLVSTDTMLSGTSFAAPVVAAVAAQQWRQSPGASREQVLSAMRGNAIDMGAPGRDPIYGWGRVDPASMSGAATASR
ncbi:MAG TPA: S8 family serine peptidase [Steroidobacteraceae bacterium]|nr:S8 family serine peptidase [Steroidobacteraceae bacterium]